MTTLAQNLKHQIKRNLRTLLKHFRPPYIAIDASTTKIQYAKTDNLFVNAPITTVKKASALIEGLYYSKQRSRKLQALIDAIYFCQHPPTTKNPTVLLVGYEYETYPVQILQRLGYEPEVYFNDIADFDAANFGPPLDKLDFHYIQEDLRQLNRKFDQPFFDYICTSRACLDCINYSEAHKALTLFTSLLKEEHSVLLTHLQTLFHSDASNKALSNPDVSKMPQLHYQSQLGDFFFGNDYPILMPDQSPFNHVDLKKEYLGILENYQKQLYIEQIPSSWLDAKLSNPSDSSINEIALSLSQDNNRIWSIEDLPGKAHLFATYLRCTPSTKRGSCYIANVVSICK